MQSRERRKRWPCSPGSLPLDVTICLDLVVALSCASVMFQIGDDEDEMEGLAGPGTGASGEEPGGQESVQSAAEVAVALASTVCPQARMFICRASSV